MDRQIDRGLTEKGTIPEYMVLVAQPHTPVFVQGPGLDLKACLEISAERPSTLHASKQGGPLLGKVVFHGEKLQEGHMDGRGKSRGHLPTQPCESNQPGDQCVADNTARSPSRLWSVVWNTIVSFTGL